MSESFKESLVPRTYLKGSEQKRVSFIKSDPKTKAVTDKLITSLYPSPKNSRGFREIGSPANQLFEKISNQTATNIIDSEAILQLLPDVKLSETILVSSILSPNDMINSELNYGLEEFPYASEVGAGMLDVVSNYFKKTYKIEAKLPEILKDILFKKGSHISVILPESSIDEIINGEGSYSLESITNVPYQSFKGILGPAVKRENAKGRNTLGSNFGLEAVNIDINRTSDGTVIKIDETPLVTVSDNPDGLKIPHVAKLFSDRQLDIALSNKNDLSLSEVERAFYNRKDYRREQTISIKNQDQLSKPTNGHPMLMNPPSESVIPVHVPGNPKDALGYFIMLDRSGHPVDRAEYLNYFNELTYNTATNNQISQLLQNVKVQSFGLQNTEFSYVDKEHAAATYGMLVENDLLLRLRNGIYGDNVSISSNEDIYRIMLARALCKMQTQFIYVPRTLVTYMAFEYNMWGVGKSLLEDSKIISSIRAMLMFANTMAEIRNAVGHETVNIELDPEDPDPARTVEFLFHEYAKNRKSQYPVGASNPLDLINYLQNAGVQIAVSGHEAYPVTKLNVESYNTNHAAASTELSDDLKKKQIQSFGIPPEAVDSAEEGEFATTVARNNLLFSKNVINYQKRFCEFLEDFHRKFTVNSSILVDQLRDVIKEKKDFLNAEDTAKGENEIIKAFLASMTISLPEPDTAKIESQKEAYETYSEFLEEAFDAYMSDVYFNDTTIGNISSVLAETKEAFLAYYKRRWLRSNNILPELEDIIDWSEEGPAVNLLDTVDAHIEGLTKSILPFMLKVAARNKANNDIIDNADAQPEAGSTDFGSTEPDDGLGGLEDDFGSTDDDMGGFDEGGDQNDQGTDLENDGESETGEAEGTRDNNPEDSESEEDNFS